MLVLFYISCICFFLLAIRWLFAIGYTHRWIKKETDCPHDSLLVSGKIFILIPVLAEVGRIEKTVEYFLDTFPKELFRLIVITTENEYSYCTTTPNSIDVAKVLAQRYGDAVIHCHYPKVGGRMSHQLNYCIEMLGDSIQNDDLIAIYNADSRPHPDTFRWILSKRQEERDLSVFQQYGDYTKNIGSKTNSVLFSASLWQNRWAAGFELFKALRSLSSFRNRIWRPLNYLIGHGLIMTKEVYDTSVGFSEVFHNEDAILGLEISHLRQKIMPLPYFDVSDTPDTISALYKQKIHWFFGPYQAFRYFVYLKKKYAGETAQEKAVLFFQSFKLFLHAIYWIFGPTFAFFILLYPLVIRDMPLFLTGYVAFFVYFTLPNLLALELSETRPIKYIRTLLLAIVGGGSICYFLHGLSALSAVIFSLKRLLTGKPITKGKTIMKQA